MEHSYEEIRKAALDILAEREKPNAYPTQYENLRLDVGSILEERETGKRPSQPRMSQEDSELFLEVFWDFFRQSIFFP